jgi:ABC-2 type transport system permease protein
MVYAIDDSLALISRSVRHSTRSIDAVIVAVLLPVMLLLLFVYVFGGALNVPGRYVDYVVPGIILLCAGYGSATTAVSVNADMTTGVIDRFRSLPIASSAVITGHVVASVLRNLVSTVLVLGVAFLIGFRPHASALDWLAVAGLLLAFMLAISWIAACFGLLAKSAEGAGAFSFVIMFLPYVSSAFVPPSTMPGALHWIGDRQPITPLVDTLRALLLGTAGGRPVAALIWCAALALVGIVSASLLFRRAA